jgi:8-oxo-dGTP diphosphatase
MTTNYPRVGVAAIIIRNDQVLLIKRKNVHCAGSWSTPGGHLDFGETPEQCAIRETREEVGIEIEDMRFVAVTNDYFEANEKHYISLWMAGSYISGEPKITADYEVAKLGWFGWDALPSPLFIPFENFVNQRSYPPDGITNLKKEKRSIV